MDYVRYELGLSSGECGRVSTSPPPDVLRVDAETWLVTCAQGVVTVHALEAGEMREIARARRGNDGHLSQQDGLHRGYPNSRQWGLIEQTIPLAMAGAGNPPPVPALPAAAPTPRLPMRVALAFASSIMMIVIFIVLVLSQWSALGSFPLHGGVAIAEAIVGLTLGPLLTFLGVIGVGGALASDSDPTATRTEAVKLDGHWVQLQRRRDGSMRTTPAPQNMEMKIMIFVLIGGIVLFALGVSAVS